MNQLGNDIDVEEAGAESGNSVAMSSDGKRIAIGSYGNTSHERYPYSGHVRVYDYKIPTTDEWSEKIIMKGSDATQQTDKYYWTRVGGDIDSEAREDRSGWSVAMDASGNRIAIGAPFNDGDDTTNSKRGHVRVYDRDPNAVLGWKKVGGDR